MKKSLLSLLLASVLALPVLPAQDIAIAKRPHIEVDGHAEGEFEPDAIFVQVKLSEKDSKGKVPVVEQEKKLLAIAKKLRIPKQDLELMGGNSHYAQYFWRKNQNETAKIYRLKTHSARQASRLLYELNKAKVSDTRITKVDRSDKETLLKGLEIQAIKNAKARASALLQSIGHRIGEPLVVIQHENYSCAPSPQFHLNSVRQKSVKLYRAQQFSPIGFKKIKYESYIQVWFAIK